MSTSKWPGQFCSSSFELHRKIKDIKQYTADEGKKVNESLKAYQTKYDQQLADLTEEMTRNFNNEQQY